MKVSSINNHQHLHTRYDKRSRSRAYNRATPPDESREASKPAEPSKKAKPKRLRRSNLTAGEKKLVSKLRRRDSEVRAHERAHIATGGKHVTGGAKFVYQTGPDGKRYAVGGEVGISTGSVSGDLGATIRKMQVVRRAALAPVKPSRQDIRIAAKATAIETDARIKISVRGKEALREETITISQTTVIESYTEPDTENSKGAIVDTTG